MDVNDLMSYQPEYTPKRPLEEEIRPSKTYIWKHRCKKFVSSTKKDEDIRLEPKSSSSILPQPAVDIANLPEPENLNNEAFLKKLLFQFEKRCLKNQEMRIKFQEQPEKFMESELELYDTIQELHFVSTVPGLYPSLQVFNFVPKILALLLHENTDIILAVISLVQEIIDSDEINVEYDIIISSFLKNNVCSLLVQNLERFNESNGDDSEGVNNILSIFENLIENEDDVCIELGKVGFITWILKRLRCPFDGNKLYASELLCVLLQNCSENRLYVADVNGIDIILQQLLFYKRHDPKCPDESEMMENLFNCLCSILLWPSNKEAFLQAEGLQLMNLMLKEKKNSRHCALKVLNYALSRPNAKDNCNKFIDILGLRTIFPIFMKPPKKYHKEAEEQVISIVSNLVRYCQGVRKQRILNKFVENDYEKVDRLVELHFKYLEKVNEVEIYNKYRMDDEEFYMLKLESGLFTLQLIDYILLDISSKGQNGIKQRVIKIINVRGGSLKTIKHIMREYAGNLGDAYDSGYKNIEEQHILHLIDKF